MPVLLLFVLQVLQMGGMPFGFKGAGADFQFVRWVSHSSILRGGVFPYGSRVLFFPDGRIDLAPTYFGASGDGSFPADSSTCRAR